MSLGLMKPFGTAAILSWAPETLSLEEDETGTGVTAASRRSDMISASSAKKKNFPFFSTPESPSTDVAWPWALASPADKTHGRHRSAVIISPDTTELLSTIKKTSEKWVTLSSCPNIASKNTTVGLTWPSASSPAAFSALMDTHVYRVGVMLTRWKPCRSASFSTSSKSNKACEVAALQLVGCTHIMTIVACKSVVKVDSSFLSFRGVSCFSTDGLTVISGFFIPLFWTFLLSFPAGAAVFGSFSCAGLLLPSGSTAAERAERGALVAFFSAASSCRITLRGISPRSTAVSSAFSCSQSF
eukprot:RCo001535